MKLTAFLPALFALSLTAFAQNTPPEGFTSLFNGKDLTGFRGGDTFDHRKLMAMPEDKRAEQIKKWTDSMNRHWKVEGSELLNDGNGAYATTEKEYGNFELHVEYNMAPKGDSGIYLRNVPQVQIWDATQEDKNNELGRAKGSGGLWNNSPGAPGKDPLVLADKPAGEWNKFRIVLVGARVSIWLNEKLVVDHATLENYYDRKTPIPATGPICLQTHGAPIKWKNIFIREIGPEESVKLLKEKGTGFQPIWNGKDFEGWAGPVENYEVKDGAIVCKKGKGGTIYTKEEYADFSAQLEFNLPKNGNNGLALRYPGEGDTAYVGFTECQVLDDNYKGIDPRQAHGSAYGMVAAARGYQFPIGQWNYQEVTLKGTKLRVELNGTVILDADVAKSKDHMANSKHPGLENKSGHFGFAGHSDPVMFRNVGIKKLN